MIDKNCPNCGNSFYGRSNRTYCSQSCKSAINNVRVAKRDEKANSIAKQVKTNRRILMNLYSIYGDKELPKIAISNTEIDLKWHSWMSADCTKQAFLDFLLCRLPNNNYSISKLNLNKNEHQ
jgi:endogenous inhibitor of DNA gyrase (YacG/DUF329 family)